MRLLFRYFEFIGRYTLPDRPRGDLAALRDWNFVRGLHFLAALLVMFLLEAADLEGDLLRWLRTGHLKLVI